VTFGLIVAVQLLGISLYAITKKWELEEWLAAATPFGTTRHTGDAIDAITLEALRKPSLGSTAEEVYAAVHSKISDNGSNMKKGWSGFAGGFCCAHTIELSVLSFTNAQGESTNPSRSPTSDDIDKSQVIPF
jgi:hypothetical protein